MSCAQIKEQLVDFLYQELPPHLRAAFLEHLRGCPGCSAEVASHEKALGQARAALGGPLLQDPPARVHAAVLAAAREAAATATRRPGPARERPAPALEPGFFARFWRTPWLLPAFGAVSVATAVFLVKVLKNPEVLPRQKAGPVEELEAPALPAAAPSAKPAIPAPSAAQPPPAAAPGARGEHEDSLGGLGRAAASTAGKAKAEAAKGRRIAAPLPLGKGAAASGASSSFAAPPPPRPAAKPSRDIDDLLKSFDSPRAAASAEREAAKRSAGQKAAAAQEADDTLLLDRAPAEADEKPSAAPRAYAAPPPATVAKPARKLAPLESSAGVPVAPRAAEPSAGAYPPPPAAPAAAGPPSPSKAMRMKDAEGRAEEATSAARADRADAKGKIHRATDQAGPPLEESIMKADRLFAAQDWTAAAEAYRDLLRRFPGYRDAPKWRDRVSQSMVAEAQRRGVHETKAAKAKAVSEPLQGTKP